MSLAAARPLISVYTDKAESGGVTVCLPAVFRWGTIFKLFFFRPFLFSDLNLLIVLGYWVSLKWFVHRAPVRPDIVSLIHHEVAKNRRQPYCVSEPAGHQVCSCSTKILTQKHCWYDEYVVQNKLFERSIPRQVPSADMMSKLFKDLPLDKCRVLGNRTRCSENPSSPWRRHSQVWGFALLPALQCQPALMKKLLLILDHNVYRPDLFQALK